MSDPPSLLPLHIWLSPAFPIGAFAYSQGLERAIEDGWITNADTLRAWLDDLVAHGAIYTDCILLALSLRTAAVVNIVALNELALALTPSYERRQETAAQGTAFLSAVATAWPAQPITALADALGERDIAYPVAVGVAAAAHGLAPRATLEAFALAAAGNLVSAALRLGPIGQSEAQAILARLCPALRALAATVEAATPDALGACALRADIAAMRHETQYSRLFRS